MARDGVHVRQSAERLGILMNSASQFDDPTEILKQHLQEFERQGLPVDKLINYGLQRYNGRTPVHLAAANGLWECLELMLRSGGGWFTFWLVCFRIAHINLLQLWHTGLV